jgi:hypothetical protein
MVDEVDAVAGSRFSNLLYDRVCTIRLGGITMLLHHTSMTRNSNDQKRSQVYGQRSCRYPRR